MRAIAAAALALAALPATAQEGIYVGAGFGSFDYAEETPLLAPETFEDRVPAWRIYGGFEFNDHFGFEIRYGGTDSIEQRFTTTDPDLGELTLEFSQDFRTTSALVIGMLPNDWGTLFGGIGYFDSSAETRLEVTTTDGTLGSDKITLTDNGLAAALGIEWRFGRFGTGYGIRLEYEWLDVDGADGSTIGVGASYRF